MDLLSLALTISREVPEELLSLLSSLDDTKWYTIKAVTACRAKDAYGLISSSLSSDMVDISNSFFLSRSRPIHALFIPCFVVCWFFTFVAEEKILRSTHTQKIQSAGKQNANCDDSSTSTSAGADDDEQKRTRSLFCFLFYFLLDCLCARSSKKYKTMSKVLSSFFPFCEIGRCRKILSFVLVRVHRRAAWLSTKEKHITIQANPSSFFFKK